MNIALGTAQFGQDYGISNKTGQVAFEEAKNILYLCKAKGIHTIDTAMNYGDSEKLLGDIGVKNLKIITKIPSVPESCPDINLWLSEQVELSLNRLNYKKLYAVMLHRPEQLLGPIGSEIFESLINQKKLAKFEKLGISIYDPNELEEILSIYNFDIIQSPFNLIDRRLVETGWLDKLKKEKIEVHTRSIFLQGLLLMQRENLPEKFNKWSKIWTEWHDWLEDNSLSALEASLNFVRSYKLIDKIVVGVDSLNQLEQIIEVMSVKKYQHNFPEIGCGDMNLINPSNWSSL